MDLLAKTNVGRDINRHYYTKDEIRQRLETPLLKKLKEIMVLRNTHQAFNGDEWAVLFVDFEKNKFKVNFSGLSEVNAITLEDF